MRGEDGVSSRLTLLGGLVVVMVVPVLSRPDRDCAMAFCLRCELN